MVKLFIISGLPSTGSGKDSVIEGLIKKMELNWVITYTTRPMRVSEHHGHSYHFISRKKFEQKKDRGEFLEWAEVYGNYYGNTKQDIKQALKGNNPVILRINYQGVKTYKKLLPDTIVILISIPSLKILESRLRKRGEDTERVILRRIKAAKNELNNPPPYDYIVVNKEGKINQTIEQVKNIIIKESNYDRRKKQ